MSFLDAIRSLAGRCLLALLGVLPLPRLETLIVGLVNRRCTFLPPDEALRFLMRLDAALYPLMGRHAVAYGGGVHTKHRHTRYHDFFVERLGKDERVLDIGCGNGILAYDIARRAGSHVVGLDKERQKIDEAKARHAHPNLEFRVGDATRDLPEESFDAVVLSNVLEHLPHRPHLLRRLMKSAKPSRFLIRVPLFERDWRVPLKKELGVEWRLDATHETEYTLESFDREIAEAGLRMIHREVRWGEIWAEAGPA